MAWTVVRSDSFDKWWKKEDVHDSNYKYFEAALKEFQNVPLPHNIQARIFENSSYECWVTRQPDKARRTGKSGGFRIVLVLDLEERRLILQGIFRRQNLSDNGNGGRHDDAYGTLVANLATEFIAPK